GTRCIEQLLQDFTAGLVRALFAEADLDQRLAAEQAHALGSVENGMPVDAGVGTEQLPVGKVVGLGMLANQVAAFAELERLVTGNEPSRQGRPGERLLQLVGPHLHYCGSATGGNSGASLTRARMMRSISSVCMSARARRSSSLAPVMFSAATW